ncbi:hypothetical protein GCM10025864_15700 [Luteimicrobium album]|uniref:TetR family transcriptional regulator n=1 Tax=Luteimicrobium album TaxID=1054550 RepID=A0ABQ6HZC4_9MICO|nr:hypothetical protein [Luteimicrobium album]GMA23811.1 hypothetical protein GCM10025864_15700 [Luteimicrobium album]
MPRVDIPVVSPTEPQLRLMEAAERTVERAGLRGATSAAITREAGHRNHSAIAYHFGTYEGLLDTVYYWRSKPINAHRAALVATAEATGRVRDAETLVRAYVEPFAEHLRSHEPSYWARYTDAVLAARPLQFVQWIEADVKRYDDMEVPLETTIDLLYRMAALITGGLSAHALVRVSGYSRYVVTVLGAWERDQELDLLEKISLDDVVREMVAVGVAVLQAP